MSDTFVMVATLLLGVGGALFFLTGTLGLLRLPDFYSRVHAATKCDTVGAGAILVALAIYVAPQADALKIIVLLVLVLLSSPTSGHALARAAYNTGLQPWRGPGEKE
ncbi:MAG: monovalent cation/H(+) antiporter subunit G [Gammaproteobacteria bacterium]